MEYTFFEQQFSCLFASRPGAENIPGIVAKQKELFKKVDASYLNKNDQEILSDPGSTLFEKMDAFSRLQTQARADDKPEFQLEAFSKNNVSYMKFLVGGELIAEQEIVEIINEVTTQNPTSLFDTKNPEAPISKCSESDDDPKISHYSDKPPIKKLNGGDVNETCKAVKGAIKAFEKAMEGWDNVDVPVDPEDYQRNIDPTDWRIPKRTVQMRWNYKLEDTKEILELIESNLRSSSKHHEYYVYEINQIPVGIMQLGCFDKNKGVEVQCLAAHPGAQTCGGSLIEWAVQRSRESECNGKLQLLSVNEAKPAYLAMGFKEYIPGEPNNLMLDPTTSAKWYEDEHGQWKLNSNKDKRYMHSFG